MWLSMYVVYNTGNRNTPIVQVPIFITKKCLKRLYNNIAITVIGISHRFIINIRSLSHSEHRIGRYVYEIILIHLFMFYAAFTNCTNYTNLL